MTSERIDPALHAQQPVRPDPDDELREADALRREEQPEALLERYTAAAHVDSPRGARLRRVLLRALCRSFGSGIQISVGVYVLHPETFEIGDGVFIGHQCFLQGRQGGRFAIGAYTWIGPQSYFHGVDLELGEYVGWGAGAKVVGSVHTGEPVDLPIIRTDLEVKPIRVGRGALIGANAVLLPGVTVGEGALIGAGAVVSRDVPPYAIAAGMPAKVVRYRLARTRPEPGGSG